MNLPTSQGLSTRRQFLETSIAGAVSFSITRSERIVQAEPRKEMEILADPIQSFHLVYEMMPTPERLPILDWVAQGGWCSHISCRPEVTDAMLEEIKRRGWRTIVTMLAHPATRARQWTAWGLPVPDVESVLARYKRIFGENFAWEVFTEDDSAGVAFPQVLLREKPKTHDAAKALFNTYIAEAMAVAGPHSDVERWGRPGYASGVHSMAAQGLDCIMVERANDDVEDLHTAIAFARGAARQSCCKWGIDFSLWWGVIYGCVQDLPALFHKRHFYMTYFAGADAVSIEGGDLLYDFAQSRPRLLGQTLEEFGRFTRQTARGKVEVPVAVILPENHGWITPAYWRTTREAWNYARIPYPQGYRGVDAFFSMAYPGNSFAMDPFPFGRYGNEAPPASPFALSCVTPEYAPSPDDVHAAEPPLPFGRYPDRHQARGDLHQRKEETSPYRPMANTRWGDVIDVLTDTADSHVLHQYKALILLGPVQVEPSLKTRLAAYVKNGGTLLLAAGAAGPDDSDLCGIQLLPELRAGAAWRWEKAPFVHEAFRYCPTAGVPAAKVSVLAQASNGAPLIVCHELGEGRVYTCLIPWFEGETAMMGAAARMLDAVITPLQPAIVEGLPLYWVSSRTHDGQIVALTNNADIEWKGRVLLQWPEGTAAECRELLTGTSVPAHLENGRIFCGMLVPPFDVRVLSWKNERLSS